MRMVAFSWILPLVLRFPFNPLHSFLGPHLLYRHLSIPPIQGKGNSTPSENPAPTKTYRNQDNNLRLLEVLLAF
jgi:hypothetical protein